MAHRATRSASVTSGTRDETDVLRAPAAFLLSQTSRDLDRYSLDEAALFVLVASTVLNTYIRTTFMLRRSRLVICLIPSIDYH